MHFWKAQFFVFTQKRLFSFLFVFLIKKNLIFSFLLKMFLDNFFTKKLISECFLFNYLPSKTVANKKKYMKYDRSAWYILTQAYSFSWLFISDVATKLQKDHKLFNTTYSMCNKKVGNKKIEGSPLFIFLLIKIYQNKIKNAGTQIFLL